MLTSETRDLEQAIDQIQLVSERFGLDPFPIHFEVVPANIMYEFGAYGLPGRFSHWTHGRAYHQTKTMYDYGLSKIYELVINTNPSYAFLMDDNSLVQNKLVAAHVVGHGDFFKNNAFFQHTDRKMLETVSTHADRIRRYEFEHGQSEVEQFLDAVLSIQEHVDPQPRQRARAREAAARPTNAAPPAPRPTAYDDLFELDRGLTGPAPVQSQRPRRIPVEPDKDILAFLAEYAPAMEEWQRDIVEIVRSEMLYFVPQIQTKIMNEGWAAYWHLRIMRELDLPGPEYTEFAQLHASVIAPSKSSLNPYYVGLKMFEDIERRWDNPTDEERQRLGRTAGEGRVKIFEVRETENDASFVRNYLTQDLVDDLDLYVYKAHGDDLVVVESDFRTIRDMIVTSMSNFGHPYIVVEDGDYHGTRELYLKHVFEGQEIDVAYAEKTLRYLHQLWQRPVHLETVLNGKAVVLLCDGEKSSKRAL